MRKHILFALCTVQLNASLFDWFSPLSDKAKRAQTLLENFDPIIEKALIDYQVPGVAIGVVVDGHLVYSKGFGSRDQEKKLPVTPQTIFPIGSCSKAFTAFTIGTLIDEGLLHWDTRIIDLCPEFRLHDQYATQNLTIRDLLTHRSGLPRHDFMWYNSNFSRSEMMKRLKYLEPSCNIRERYQYNNIMYMATGYAIEQFIGKPWESIVEDKILKRLDMKNTNFDLSSSLKGEIASPYILQGSRLEKMSYRDIGLIGPAGAMNSNVQDLAKWMQMNLDGGIYNNTPLINPILLQEIQTPQIIVPGAPETKETLHYAYALGWGVVSYRGQYFLSHDGVSDGFTSTVGILPHHKVGVVVLSNRNCNSLPRFLSLTIIDKVLELPFIDWLKEGLDGQNKSQSTEDEQISTFDQLQKKGTIPSHCLSDYEGLFEHPGYGTIKIHLHDNRLYMEHNNILSTLDHWHYDVFNIADEDQHTFFSRRDSKITFYGNVNGEINQVAIPFEPNVPDIIFSRKHIENENSVNYLKKFCGLYEIYGYTVEVTIRNQSLCAIIPGQPMYELVPTIENEFFVKSLNGYNIRFILDNDGKIQEALFVQPYGAFTARPKK